MALEVLRQSKCFESYICPISFFLPAWRVTVYGVAGVTVSKGRVWIACFPFAGEHRLR